MHVSGKYTFNAARPRVWSAIYNVKALLEIIPGCQQMEQVSDTEYRGQIQMRLPAVVGTYHTYMKRVEFEAPRYSRFEGEVDGTLGTIKGWAAFWLTGEGEQTVMEYEGQGLITGSLAMLNSRFVEGLAKSLIEQGLTRLNQQLQNQEG